jgi:hypothetical protein
VRCGASMRQSDGLPTGTLLCLVQPASQTTTAFIRATHKIIISLVISYPPYPERNCLVLIVTR